MLDVSMMPTLELFISSWQPGSCGPAILMETRWDEQSHKQAKHIIGRSMLLLYCTFEWNILMVCESLTTWGGQESEKRNISAQRQAMSIKFRAASNLLTSVTWRGCCEGYTRDLKWAESSLCSIKKQLWGEFKNLRPSMWLLCWAWLQIGQSKGWATGSDREVLFRISLIWYK